MRNERLESAAADLRNGLVPVPEQGDIFVGDGAYAEIGAEFLRYFVEVGGLRPDHSVLDIGSGIGRITAGLSRYLDPQTGSYIGFDPMEKGVDWCRAAYSHLPNFRFVWADIFNELYRPDGAILSTEYVFPCEDHSIDFAIATSVFTHLYEQEIGAYLNEVARVLKHDGRLFATAYLFDGERPPEVQIPHLRFNKADPDHPYRWHVEGASPLAAVCYSQSYLAQMIEKESGRKAEISKGRWRGGQGPWFQDLVLL
ncbi:MAG: SAM-dependent methyltransferase [Rhizobium sp.]|nr:SAM-dependent methyltransferase [Rhizobium sp.]